MAKDYNDFAQYFDSVITETELAGLIRDSRAQPEDADVRNYTEDWMKEKFDEEVDWALKKKRISAEQAESMKKNFDSFAQKTVEGDRVVYTRPDRKGFVDLSKYLQAVEEREGTKIPGTPRYQKSEEVLSREQFLRKNKGDEIKNLVNADKYYEGTINDYLTVLSKEKIDVEEEMNKQRIKEALVNRGINYSDDASFEDLKKTANKNYVAWDEVSLNEIKDKEAGLNVLALKLPSNMTDTEKKRQKELFKDITGFKKEIRDLYQESDFDKKKYEKKFNSYLGNLKRIPSYDIRKLDEETVTDQAKSNFRQKTLNMIKKTQDPSDLVAIKSILQNKDQADYSRYELLEIEKKLAEKTKELNKKVAKERKRDIVEIKEILKLQGKKIRGKSDTEILRIARNNDVSTSKARVESPEELIVNIASFKSTSPKDMRKQIKKLKNAYDTDNTILERLKTTNEQYVTSLKPEPAKKTDVYVTMKDFPSEFANLKKVLGITKKDYNAERNKILTEISREQKIGPRKILKENILSPDELEEKTTKRLITNTLTKKAEIPIMELELEKRFKELKKIPLSEELSLTEKEQLARQLQSPISSKIFAGKKTIPKKTIMRDGKEITYKPTSLAKEYYPQIPDIKYGEAPSYFKIKEETKKDMLNFKVGDVKSYGKELMDTVKKEEEVLSKRKIFEDSQSTLEALRKDQQRLSRNLKSVEDNDPLNKLMKQKEELEKNLNKLNKK